MGRSDPIAPLILQTGFASSYAEPEPYRFTPAQAAATAMATGDAEAAFDALIEAGASIVVLDASAIQFIDSTGLRSVVAASNKLSARGGRLLIEGMSGAVQRVLEVTGLIDRYRE